MKCVSLRSIVLNAPCSYADNKEEQEKTLQAFARGKAAITDIVWAEPFWISAADLAQDKKIITTMEVGALSTPFETPKDLSSFA